MSYNKPKLFVSIFLVKKAEEIIDLMCICLVSFQCLITDLMDWYLEKKAIPYILNTITDQINLE